MILELNASDDRGIEVVRQQVQDFASTKSISFGPKVNVKLVILDEADAMTKEAQFALRRIIEKYTKSTRFCLICNYASKIIPALQSRCTRFRFAPLDPANVTERLRYVIQQESLDVTDGGLAAIVRLVNGDLRKALNILQSAQMASPHLTEEAVYLCTGNPMPKDIEQIAFWLLNEPFSTAYQKITQMKTSKGLALVDVVKELQPFVFSINMPSAVRVQLIDALADIEYRLAFGTNEKLQLGALLGAFTHARTALVAAAR
jgi:replication factor C subunit 3/5